MTAKVCVRHALTPLVGYGSIHVSLLSVLRNIFSAKTRQSLLFLEPPAKVASHTLAKVPAHIQSPSHRLFMCCRYWLTSAESLDKLEILYSELMRGCCELFVSWGFGYLVGSQGFCIVAEVGDELFLLLALFVIDWGRIGSGAPVAVQQFMRTLLDGRGGHAVTARSASDGR